MGLFTGWIGEINPKALGYIPTGMQSLKNQAKLSKLKNMKNC